LRKRRVKQLLVGTSFMLLLSVVAFAQQRTVSGTVTSSTDGLPLAGVNVIVSGTSTGTITDVQGHYSLGVPGGDVSLQFSFMGYEIQLISVGSSTVIDVQLVLSFMELDEVVITSLGIQREKKRITYAAQNVETEQITQARELNVANSLAGKVAGLDLIKSSYGVGSASRVVLRGNSSIAANNQPLYVVDGVPIINESRSSVSSEMGGMQSADGISDINPDDIESITVLKGPNATALYGSRAGNGAIVISTKKGNARKGIGVEFSSNYMFEKPIMLTRFQQKYGQGSAGVYIKDYASMWGPEMTGQMVDHWSPDPNWEGPAQYAFLPHPDNVKDFFVTGSNWANTLAITKGDEKSQIYLSYTNTRAHGIVENNKMRRHNVNLRYTSKFGKRLSADTRITYFNQDVDNRPWSGPSYGSSLTDALYTQPSNISLEEAQNYAYYDDAGNLLQHSWKQGEQNVYWLLNKIPNAEMCDRVLGMASLKYEFTEGLSLMFRTSFDKKIERWEDKAHNGTYYLVGGYYGLSSRDAVEINNEMLLNYNTMFGDMISLDVSAGGNMLMSSWSILHSSTGIYPGLLKPNLFALTNTSQIFGNQNGAEKQVHSLYGFATIGFKNFLFLDITGRNDWSSTLPKENWSYFYPSVGLTWILTELLKSTPKFLTFAKVRANYAEVGNDTEPYAIHNTYSFEAGGQLGYAWRSGILAAQNLKPENTKSTELGFDIRFFKNRVGVDFTWYKSNTFNQLLRIPLPIASGYSSKFINAGNMQNQGMEITLNATPVRIRDFSWDISFNYARNKSELIELLDDLSEYTIRGGSMMSTIKVVVGEPYGQIYTRGFIRNDQDRILINNLGLPIMSPGQTMPMGNYNPDWFGGFSNTFHYKGINLNILFDIRMGGDIFSFTEASLAGGGYSDYTLEGRDGMVVDGVMESDGSENVIETTAEAYWKSLSQSRRWGYFGEAFKYDASFIRVRELVMGYTINFNHNPSLQSLRVALVGRNLGFLYNAAEVIDPNLSMGTTNAQGVEGFLLPTTRSFGVNLKFTF